MGYVEMSSEDMNVLYAWLVEEVGELGRVLVRKRFETADHEKERNDELGDVWNTLHAIAFKVNIMPSRLKSLADAKSDEKLKELAYKENEARDDVKKGAEPSSNLKDVPREESKNMTDIKIPSKDDAGDSSSAGDVKPDEVSPVVKDKTVEPTSKPEKLGASVDAEIASILKDNVGQNKPDKPTDSKTLSEEKTALESDNSKKAQDEQESGEDVKKKKGNGPSDD